jgi:hypothetical protein
MRWSRCPANFLRISFDGSSNTPVTFSPLRGHPEQHLRTRPPGWSACGTRCRSLTTEERTKHASAVPFADLVSGSVTSSKSIQGRRFQAAFPLRSRVVRFGGWHQVSMESLILAQDERWRRASYMQVERGPSHRKMGEDRVANG